MKLAIVYTGTTKELVEMVEGEVRKRFEGEKLELLHYEAPDVIADVKEKGYVSAAMKERLLRLYETAGEQAKLLFHICSSVREAAEEAKPLLEKRGVRLVHFDERMLQTMAERYERLGLMGTLGTALGATRRYVEQYAEKIGKQPELTEYLVESSFGLGQKELGERCLDVIQREALLEAVILVQGSMACVEEELTRELGIPVVSGLEFGVEELWEAYKSYEH